MLTIVYDGAWLLIDSDVEFFLDGRPVGNGTTKKGFFYRCNLSAGDHLLLAKIKNYIIKSPYYPESIMRFNIKDNSDSIMIIKYNRFNGKFHISQLAGSDSFKKQTANSSENYSLPSLVLKLRSLLVNFYCHIMNIIKSESSSQGANGLQGLVNRIKTLWVSGNEGKVALAAVVVIVLIVVGLVISSSHRSAVYPQSASDGIDVNEMQRRNQILNNMLMREGIRLDAQDRYNRTTSQIDRHNQIIQDEKDAAFNDKMARDYRDMGRNAYSFDSAKEYYDKSDDYEKWALESRRRQRKFDDGENK